MDRRSLLKLGLPVLLLLATGSLTGRYNASHGDQRNWGRRANGNLQFFGWGMASIIGALLLAALCVPASWSDRLDGMLPLRGRWARGAVIGLLALLFAAFALLPFSVVY